MDKKNAKVDFKNKEMSLAEHAYFKIKEDILRNKFPSGEFISIADLSHSLEGMGRTPVREAVQRLHDERLLIVVPRKGVIIPEFDIKKMIDQLELRYVLEKYAAVKAAGKLDDEQYEILSDIMKDMEDLEGKSSYHLAKLNMDFHMKIAQLVNNKELIQTLSRIYDHHVRIYTYFLADKMRLESTREEHIKLLQALRAADIAAIEKAVEDHYENTRMQLLDSIMT